MRPARYVPSVEVMKKALITGASRGLGRALAGGLAAAGYVLVIDARDGQALAGAASAIRGSAPGADVTALVGDITDPAHRLALRAAAAEIDLLVNNAGTLGAGQLPVLADYPPEELRAVFEDILQEHVGLWCMCLPALRE